MNADRALLRTRIRQDALPALVAAAGPAAVRHLADFAALAREDEGLLSALAEDAFRRLALGEGTLDAAGVRALLPPLRRRVIARLLEERGLEVDLPTVQRALEALESGGRVHLSRDAHLSRSVELRCAGGVVRLVETTRPEGPPPVLQLLLERVVVDAASGYRFGLTRSPPERTEVLEVPPEALPLTVRRRQPGDRVRAGPGGGSRKLSDVLVDLRVRAEARDALPVVADETGRILFIPGVFKARIEVSSGLYLYARLHDS